jgi:hypothetical protein
MTRKKSVAVEEPPCSADLLAAKLRLLEQLTAEAQTVVERERVAVQLRRVRERQNSKTPSLEQVAAEMRKSNDAWLQLVEREKTTAAAAAAAASQQAASQEAASQGQEELAQVGRAGKSRVRRAVDMHRALFDLRGDEDEQISEEINPDLLWDQSVRQSKKRVLCMTRVAEKPGPKRQKTAASSGKKTNTSTNSSVSDEREYCRDNDLCETCKVPMRSLSKESLLVCLGCSRPQTAFRNTPASQTAEKEETSKNVADREKTYRQFLMQFLEGTRVPDSVIARLKVEARKTIHLVARPEYQITRVRELMDALKMREWLAYSLRITLQLLGREMPSLMMSEIELAVEIDAFMFRVYEMDPSVDKTYPNAKRRSEMIFIWMGMPYFAKVFATAKVATKRSHFQLFDTVTQILIQRGFYSPEAQ